MILLYALVVVWMVNLQSGITITAFSTKCGTFKHERNVEIKGNCLQLPESTITCEYVSQLHTETGYIQKLMPSTVYFLLFARGGRVGFQEQGHRS